MLHPLPHNTHQHPQITAVERETVKATISMFDVYLDDDDKEKIALRIKVPVEPAQSDEDTRKIYIIDFRQYSPLSNPVGKLWLMSLNKLFESKWSNMANLEKAIWTDKLGRFVIPCAFIQSYKWSYNDSKRYLFKRVNGYLSKIDITVKPRFTVGFGGTETSAVYRIRGKLGFCLFAIYILSHVWGKKLAAVNQGLR